MRLEGKTAIVTGGGGDIGRGIVRAFAREGARQLIVDLREDAAAKAAAEDGGTGALSLGADVTKESEVKKIARTAIEQLGRVDILVNCHGRPARILGNPIDRLTLDEWEGVMSVNLTSVFLLCREMAPHFREHRYGKVINIASMAGRRANENVIHYAASKAGVISFTQSFAKEMARYNVNVNAINPGLLWTQLWEKGHGVLLAQDADEGARPTSREVFDNFVKAAVPLGREQTPDDIGNLAVYLASDESQNMTGQALMLAGGAWMS